MQAVRPRGGARVLAVTLLAGLAVAGCTGGGSGSSGAAGTSGASGAGAGGPAAAEPGREPTAYPVPASATPAPLPSLGTRTGGRWVLTLNEVRRSGAGAVVVTATVSTATSSSEVFKDFAEPGYATREDAAGKLASTHEFSGVTLTVPGSTTQYQVMRDADGICACTQGLISVDKDRPQAVYAYVTAPPGASTVTVNVQGFAPFTGVRVEP